MMAMQRRPLVFSGGIRSQQMRRPRDRAAAPVTPRLQLLGILALCSIYGSAIHVAQDTVETALNEMQGALAARAVHMWDKNRQVMVGCQVTELAELESSQCVPQVGAPGITKMANGVQCTLYPDSSTMEMFVGEQVAVVRAADHMVEKVVKGRDDGSFVEEFPSGTVITYRPDGSSVKVELDKWGPENNVTNDGRIVETKANGVVYTIYNEKAGKTTLEKFAGGRVLVSRASADGLVTKITEGQDDGSVIESLPDGTVTLYRPNGTHRTTKVDGTVVDDGTQKKQCESGAEYTVYPDKSTLENFAGRQTLVFRAADSMVTRVVEGHEDGTNIDYMPDGTIILHPPGGADTTTTTAKGPNGEKLKRKTDGTFVFEKFIPGESFTPAAPPAATDEDVPPFNDPWNQVD